MDVFVLFVMRFIGSTVDGQRKVVFAIVVVVRWLVAIDGMVVGWKDLCLALPRKHNLYRSNDNARDAARIELEQLCKELIDAGAYPSISSQSHSYPTLSLIVIILTLTLTLVDR